MKDARLAAGALALVSGALLANHIDLITDDPDAPFELVVVAPAFPVADLTQSLSQTEVLGGERYVGLALSEPELGGSAAAAYEQGSDVITFDHLSGLGYATLTLEYGRDTPLGEPGVSGVDFTDGWNCIAVDLPIVGEAGELVITVESGRELPKGETIGHVTREISDPGRVLFVFDHPGFFGVDFTNVTRVELSLRNTEIALPGGGFAIGSITRDFVCRADCDGNGTLNIFDFLCFQSDFGNQDPAADMDYDGDWDVFDFLQYQTAFGNGCP